MPSRIDLAKIHIAKQELGLDDADYRRILRDRYDRDSAAELSDNQSANLIALFRAKGWRRVSVRQRALIFTLWHQLEASGTIRHPGPQALATFVEHATGKQDMSRLTVHEASRVIERLKRWRERTGGTDRRH